MSCYAQSRGRSCEYYLVEDQQPGEDELIRCRHCTSTRYTGYIVPRPMIRPVHQVAPDRPAGPALGVLIALAGVLIVVLYAAGNVQGWW